MAGNPDEWPEVIDPHAFDGKLPAEIPLTDSPGGNRIGTAKATKDAKGVAVSITMPAPDGVKPGDVVELYQRPDGTMAAQVRIPAPE